MEHVGSIVQNILFREKKLKWNKPRWILFSICRLDAISPQLLKIWLFAWKSEEKKKKNGGGILWTNCESKYGSLGEHSLKKRNKYSNGQTSVN